MTSSMIRNSIRLNRPLRSTQLKVPNFQYIQPIALQRNLSSSILNKAWTGDLTKDVNYEEHELERYADQADVLIVGGGPAGLTSAIKLKQLADAEGKDIRICVFEKASEFGRHTLSGACLEIKALLELWSMEELKEMDCPAVRHPVTQDKLLFLTKNKSANIPIFSFMGMNNHGNYIVRLGHLVTWLSEQAESMGIELYPGFAATETLYHEDGSIKGIATNDVGIDKSGKPKDSFARGMEFHGKITIFGEGCRGSESQKLIEKFKLEGSCPQTYGIGMKELWRVDPSVHEPGKILHTCGWPLKNTEYGGSFMYHLEEEGEHLVSCGFVIGLDYPNPYLNTFKTFQEWKTHPEISKVLKGGECLQYGARALNEGGYQAMNKMATPGGLIIGCSAGLLNVPKIKGTHLAMKSGIVAAETIFKAFQDEDRMKTYWEEPVFEEEEDVEAEAEDEEEEDYEEEEPEWPTLLSGVHLSEFDKNIENSWIKDDLYAVRNAKPSFHSPLGMYGFMAYTGFTSITKGKEPWTLKWKSKDNESLDKNAKDDYKYSTPDGKLTFDILTQVSLSGTNHNDDQPPHLVVKTQEIAENNAAFANPETRYCPAMVYETTKGDDGKLKMVINAQNCVHCKTCSIKDPNQDILWTCPEGSGGPVYDGM